MCKAGYDTRLGMPEIKKTKLNLNGPHTSILSSLWCFRAPPLPCEADRDEIKDRSFWKDKSIDACLCEEWCWIKESGPTHTVESIKRSFQWNEHLFSTAVWNSCQVTEPWTSCAAETSLCHWLAATGVLISDIMINKGLIRAGQSPVSRISLQ